VRYRTTAITCFVLIGGMFAVPAFILAMFLPSLKQGLPNPVPVYERVLLEVAFFCEEWRWLVLLPLVGLGLAFTVAELTISRARG
jgi:type II secretory pathway component PulF